MALFLIFTQGCQDKPAREGTDLPLVSGNAPGFGVIAVRKDSFVPYKYEKLLAGWIMKSWSRRWKGILYQDNSYSPGWGAQCCGESSEEALGSTIWNVPSMSIWQGGVCYNMEYSQLWHLGSPWLEPAPLCPGSCRWGLQGGLFVKEFTCTCGALLWEMVLSLCAEHG